MPTFSYMQKYLLHSHVSLRKEIYWQISSTVDIGIKRAPWYFSPTLKTFKSWHLFLLCYITGNYCPQIVRNMHAYKNMELGSAKWLCTEDKPWRNRFVSCNGKRGNGQIPEGLQCKTCYRMQRITKVEWLISIDYRIWNYMCTAAVRHDNTSTEYSFAVNICMV